MTTDYMRKTLLLMHSDDDWKRYITKLPNRNVRELFVSSLKRGQLKDFPQPKHENEQLDITDVFGIEY